MVADPVVATSTFMVFGLLYVGISAFSRSHLRRNSEVISAQSTRAIRAIQEGLGGIRDVIIDGTQERYIETFRTSDRPLKAAIARNAVIGGSPRFVVETVGMILIAMLAFLLSQSESGIAAALPTLGVMALGAQRILPLLQQGTQPWRAFAAAKSPYGKCFILSTLIRRSHKRPVSSRLR